MPPRKPRRERKRFAHSSPQPREGNRRATRYYDRKGQQQCVECGVAIGPDRQLCDRHLAAARKANAASMARSRATLRANGLCAEGCGRKSQRYRCATCRPTTARNPGVDGGVYGAVNRNRTRSRSEGVNGKSSWSWRTETDGRRRKRGTGRGHRGAPTTQETDGFDLRTLTAELERAMVDYAAYWSNENQDLPKIQRSNALRSALGHLELLGRTTEELVERWRKRLR